MGAKALTYQEALDYIHARTQFGIKLGLDRIRYLLELCDHPHQKYPVIHIAGTNGKGSVVALITSVLSAAGYKVGRFISPHLSSYTERFSINNRNISEDRVGELVSRLKPVLERTARHPLYSPPTEFEVATLLAFQYFAEEKVDVAVIEVGMGGRFDSTNVVDPVVCGITHIALDHREYLGDTISAIAAEKAGIIKPGRPVVVGVQEQEAFAVLEEAAAKAKAPFYAVGRDFRYKVTAMDLDGVRLEIEHGHQQLPTLRVGLTGRHQAANAALAYGLLSVAKEAGLNWTTTDLLRGFAEVKWPGRLEFFPGTPPLLMDGGHNPDGFTALAEVLSDLFAGYQIYLVIGILNNRPIKEMVSILAPRISKVFATKAPDLKSTDPTDLAEEFQKHGVEAAAVEEPRMALQLALSAANGEGRATDGKNRLILVAGSLYLVGALRPEVMRLYSSK